MILDRLDGPSDISRVPIREEEGSEYGSEKFSTCHAVGFEDGGP